MSPVAPTRRICVYCSSSSRIEQRYLLAARGLGDLIARRGHSLVFGGAAVGLMHEVAEAALAGGAEVLGVIPEYIQGQGIAHTRLTELVVTRDMRERKRIMEERSDAFVCLPGGFGTLEEILEVLTLKQLSYHDSPVVFVNLDGFYDGLFAFFEQLFRMSFARREFRSLYHVAEDAENALRYIEEYVPEEPVSKWL